MYWSYVEIETNIWKSVKTRNTTNGGYRLGVVLGKSEKMFIVG